MTAANFTKHLVNRIGFIRRHKTTFSFSFEFSILLLFVAVVGYRLAVETPETHLVVPKQVYNYSLNMRYQANTDQTMVGTFLPTDTVRQTVYQTAFSAPNTSRIEYSSSSGLVSRWNGNKLSDAIHYSAVVGLKEARYVIDPVMPLPKYSPAQFPLALGESEFVQVDHPEILSHWQQIQPEQGALVLPVLKAIFQSTVNLESLPFKGTTDALSALRLGAASCNGKSRLFAALARGQGLPTRLVGGVILTSGRKKTSHQWVEVYLNEQWVPFDPTNQHFAYLPANYLELYRGDHNMFSHTANINFDYQYSVNKALVSPALMGTESEAHATNQASTGNLLTLFSKLDLSEQNKALFLLMPICALLITALRNLVGLKSFGIFMPMLIATACSLVGLQYGLTGFVVILLLATLSYLSFSSLNLLKIPRLAVTITLLTVFTLFFMQQVEDINRLQVGLLSLFPVIIISFIADKLHDLVQQQEWKELVLCSVGTMISIVMCYSLLSSTTLAGAFVVFPELYLLVLAGQIYLGRWTGGRLSELMRFRHVLNNKSDLVGMNKRNKVLVGELNDNKLLVLAADKLASKQVLTAHGVPVPGTIGQFAFQSDLSRLPRVLQQLDAFVVKPNAGSQGNGILVVSGKKAMGFQGPSGKVFSQADIKQLISEIINGNYSQLGDSDTAYLEPLITQDSRLQTFAPYGLCDVRLVIKNGLIISAMLRVPTKTSNGKANLHQGAIGAAIDLETGVINRALIKGKEIEHHPDNAQQVVGRQLPYWSQIKQISLDCFEAIPLGYMGVDICIDEKLGPIVLEVNGRPGLEIQNITQKGLLRLPLPIEPSMNIKKQFA